MSIIASTLVSLPAQADSAITVGTTNFGAGVATNLGISLTGFDETQSYQATVKFVDNRTSEDVTNGVLAATPGATSLVAGYSSYSAVKLGFRGTYAAVAQALSSVTWNPANASGNISVRIGMASQAGENGFYDANSQHYYRYVSTPKSWYEAREIAENTYLFGLQGYLAEVGSAAENAFIGTETSAPDIWIGAIEDEATAANPSAAPYDGTAGKRWIWQGAVETPLPASTGASALGPDAAFEKWAGGEPNNDSRNAADCAVTNWGGGIGFWNDLPCTSAQKYLIEFGGREVETSTASTRTITATVVAKEAVTLGNLRSDLSCTLAVDCSFPLSLVNPTAKNSANEDLDGVFTYTSSNTASTTVVDGVGGASVSVVRPGVSTITVTFTPTNTTLYAANTKSFVITVLASAPSSATTLRATAGNTSASLTWSPGTDGGAAITDYLVQYSTNNSTWQTFSDGVSTNAAATVTGLTNQTLYYFRVSAINSVGTGPASSTASARPFAPAPAPSVLSAVAGNASASLTWTPGALGGSPLEDYLVEFSIDDSNWQEFTDGISTAATATVTGLTNGTLYFFRVSAIDGGGAGIASTSASATPVAPVAPPAPPAPAISPIPIPSASPSPTAAPKPTPTGPSNPVVLAPPVKIESGSLANPAELVERLIEALTEFLRPITVDVFAAPKPNAPKLADQTALNLVTAADKKISNMPSLLLFDDQYQPTKLVIVEKTIAQVVAPTGGVISVQAKNANGPVAVSTSGRVQMVKSNSVVAQGNGLAPNTEFAVYLFSKPTLLGVGKTNNKGEFFITFNVKNKIPLGNHTLQVNGLLSDGRVSSVSMPVMVVDSVEIPAETTTAETNSADEATETKDVPYLVTALLIFIILFVLFVVARLIWALAKRRKKNNA